MIKFPPKKFDLNDFQKHYKTFFQGLNMPTKRSYALEKGKGTNTRVKVHVVA
jgi:hypothetical protein